MLQEPVGEIGWLLTIWFISALSKSFKIDLILHKWVDIYASKTEIEMNEEMIP